MNNTKRLASIDTLLGTIPQFQCVEGCADCCGPVQMSRLELARILTLSGKSKNQLHSEMKEALKHSLNRSEVHAQLHGSCPLLDKTTHKCSVYDARPAICHLFGAVDIPKLTCPHGRKPATLLTKEQCEKTLDDIAKIGHGNDREYLAEAQGMMAQAYADFAMEGMT